MKGGFDFKQVTGVLDKVNEGTASLDAAVLKGKEQFANTASQITNTANNAQTTVYNPINNQTSPGLLTTGQTSVQNPPALGQNPPALGQTLPALGQTSGQTPPALGQSQIPVAAGQTQPTPVITYGQSQIPAATGENPPAATTGQPPSNTNTKNTDPNKSKLFSWDNLVKFFKQNDMLKNIMIVLIICVIAVSIYFAISSSKNTTPKKTKKEGFFGDDEDPEETKEKNSNQVKIDDVERQLQDRITNINTNLTALKKRMDDADIVKDNKPTNLAIAIQNNILAVKEAMMKIIAGLVVQTKMNNGALNVVSQTNAFQQGINDSLKKFK